MARSERDIKFLSNQMKYARILMGAGEINRLSIEEVLLTLIEDSDIDEVKHILQMIEHDRLHEKVCRKSSIERWNSSQNTEV